jgi:DNA-binding transcriptional ArsR family regulator
MSNIATYATVLTAMGNPKRLEVLEILLKGEMNVTDLALEVGLSKSALSQHLSKLRARDLVSTRREGQTIYYAVKSPLVIAVIDALKAAQSAPMPDLAAAA